MNKRDLANLIALGEGLTTEFKRSNTSNLGREICAYANATGGVILIGVTGVGEAVGVNDHNRLKSEVQVIARSAEPPIAVEVESVGEVLCVTVPAQPESQPESLEMRVLALLRNGPMAKSALSIELGQKRISGHLNRLIRLLLDDDVIEYTIPDKPNTRLQRYLLTAKGKEFLERREGRGSASCLEVP